MNKRKKNIFWATVTRLLI